MPAHLQEPLWPLPFRWAIQVKEIENLIGQTNFKKFNDGRYLFVGGISRVKKYFGWYRGKQLAKWLGNVIEQKTGNADITFEQMHQQGYRDLYVTGTCLNKQRPVIFSYASYPKMKVKDAVRISAGIPLYFEAVFMDSTGSIYIIRSKSKDWISW